jgi:ligand-binding SRPBCC domain-containing protein
MKTERIETVCLLHGSMEEAWEFFSTPINLNRITPPDMSFEILTPLVGQKMYAGMIINYKVRPFLNLPINWTTEITHCEEGKYFVDEQRFGPYAFWHHKHFFEPAGEKLVKMTDVVDYAVGMGFLGGVANKIYVRRRLKEIFEYRTKIVSELFPAA